MIPGTKGRILLPYDETQHDLAKVLGRSMANHAEDIATAVGRSVRRTKGDQRGIVKTVNRLAEDYDTIFQDTPRLSGRVEALLGEAMRRGAGKFSDRGMLDAVSKADNVLAGNLALVREYTNTYVRRIVKDAVKRAVTKNADASIADIRSAVELAVNKALAPDAPYWNTLANTGVGRAYHYGMVGAADVVHNRHAMYMSIRDDDTTPFCWNIDGLVVPIAAIQKQMELVAKLRKSAIRQYKPWDEIKSHRKPTVKSMIQKGILIPPFHAHCRTTIHCY